MTTIPEQSIFTKIINREIPAHIVYENEHVIGFFTIEPINPGHTLIVPKQPFRNILDGDEVILGHMMVAAKKVANALIAHGYATGINLIMNNEPDASQEVFHAHLHVVPRTKDDGALLKPRHTIPTEAETLSIASKLRTALA